MAVQVLVGPQQAAEAPEEQAAQPAITRESLGRDLMVFLAGKTARLIVKHVLLAALLIAAVYACSEWQKVEAEEFAESLVAPLYTGRELTFGITTFTDEEKARLTTQFGTVRERWKLHLVIMKYYYTRYYMAIITFSLTAALAAILLVLVSKSGWKEANQYVVNAFFILTAASVFYNAWPGVFKNEQNITDNKVLFLQYLALENELLSYAVTGEALNYEYKLPSTVPTEAEKALQAAASDTDRIGIHRAMNVRDFIHLVDLRLAKDNVALGFDYQKVPNYNNVFATE